MAPPALSDALRSLDDDDDDDKVPATLSLWKRKLPLRDD